MPELSGSWETFLVGPHAQPFCKVSQNQRPLHPLELHNSRVKLPHGAMEREG